MREFTQCDIDIIGNASPDAEIDLILTTAKALKRIGITEFQVNTFGSLLLYAFIVVPPL